MQKTVLKKLITVLVIIVLGFFAWIFWKHSSVQKIMNALPHASSSSSNTTYHIKQFDLATVQGISKNQLDQHKTLYEGYVKKRNEIAQKLQTVDRSNPNKTYSPFRELKVEETYAINGSLLHELYFENIGKQDSHVGNQMLKFIEESFGSIDAFKQDLMDTANCSRGWVVTGYSMDDKKIHNFLLEEHHHNVPVLMLPLLVLDVYEHAYMIDFGIQRNPYLDAFWNNINWDVVEQRINTWIHPLQQVQ